MDLLLLFRNKLHHIFYLTVQCHTNFSKYFCCYIFIPAHFAHRIMTYTG